MINNRQAGRRRGRGGQQQRPQGGGSGRPDNGNRIDNRARGNASQLLEKYKSLARDAQMQGDRVNTEYYLQFADHYFRVLAETRARFEENGQSTANMRRQTGATLDEDEPDYEDEGEPARGSDQMRGDQARNDQQRGDQRGGGQSYAPNGNQGERGNGQHGGGQYDDDRPRNRQNGNGEYRHEAAQDRSTNGADCLPRGGNDRYENGNRAERNDRPDRPERTARPAYNDRPEPVSRQPENDAVDAAPLRDDAPPAEQPRRGRGRPRRDVGVVPVMEAAPVFEAHLLPPSLTVSAVVPTDDEPEVKPRRRGRPPKSATVTAD